MIPTESWSGVSTWNVRPYMSGDIRSATGTRTDVTYFDRSPYATSSFASSLGFFDVASAAGVCAFAVSAAPIARPARAALFFRNPRRSGRLVLMGRKYNPRVSRFLRLFATSAFAFAASSGDFSVVRLTAPPSTNWPTNGGNLYNQRYSPLKGIDRTNVTRLKGVW